MSGASMPLVRDSIPLALAAVESPRTRELYAHYLTQFSGLLGHLPLDRVRPSDVRGYAQIARDSARRRRTSVNGDSAYEHAVTAVRHLFAVHIADGCALASNPGLGVAKPARQESRRTPLTSAQIGDLFRVVTDDETMVLRLLLETGARREGVIGLEPEALRRSRQTVMLVEKGTKVREQPISAAMCEAMQDPAAPVYAWTRRRFDGLWLRVRGALPWAEEVGLSTHWLRHTAINHTEQVTGSYVIAAHFAGHSLSGQGATGTYVKVGIRDMARALSLRIGERHPLWTPDE